MITQNYSVQARNIEIAYNEPDESVFYFDESEINIELSQLNELDNFLESNSGTTYELLVEEGNSLITNIAGTASPIGTTDENVEPPLGIPSFLWGCFFGFIGLIVVALMTDSNKDEIKKAMYGCLTSAAVVVVFYLIVFGATFVAVEATL